VQVRLDLRQVYASSRPAQLQAGLVELLVCGGRRRVLLAELDGGERARAASAGALRRGLPPRATTRRAGRVLAPDSPYRVRARRGTQAGSATAALSDSCACARSAAAPSSAACAASADRCAAEGAAVAAVRRLRARGGLSRPVWVGLSGAPASDGSSCDGCPSSAWRRLPRAGWLGALRRGASSPGTACCGRVRGRVRARLPARAAPPAVLSAARSPRHAVRGLPCSAVRWRTRGARQGTLCQ